MNKRLLFLISLIFIIAPLSSLLAQDAPFKVSVELKENSCFGIEDAQIIIVNVDGGVAPYQYKVDIKDSNTGASIKNGTYQDSNVIKNLPPATYVVTIKDSSGKTYVLTAFTSPADKLDFNLYKSAPSTDNSSDGRIELQPTAGVPPIHFKINDGEYKADRSYKNLPNGLYTVTMKDSKGCTVSKTVLFGDPAPLTATLEIQDNLCYQGEDGSISIKAQGGLPPYTYQLNDQTPTSEATISGLTSGNYTVTVADSQNQTYKATAQLFGPAHLAADLILQNPSCSNTADGGVKLDIRGGVPPFQVKMNDGDYETKSHFGDLGPGTFKFTVKDSNNCTSSYSATLQVEDGADFDKDGITDSCDTDIDGDGVPNSLDNCPKSPLGEKVGKQGCKILDLKQDAFQITVKKACPNQKNGTLLLKTDSDLIFNLKLLDKNLAPVYNTSFQDAAEINNLEANSYVLVVTHRDYPTFEQILSANIAPLEKIAVKHTLLKDNKVKLELQGADTYNIYHNGKRTKVEDNEMTLDLEAGRNAISVSTDLECQGSWSEIFSTQKEITVYPNPVSNSEPLKVELSSQFNNKLSSYAIYSSSGIVVKSGQYMVNDNIIEIAVNNLPAGIYTLIVDVKDSRFTKKIAKN
ncbi:MAG: thrombospondin type 3 repeat-containing protein [Flavobacteriaceae bacterium]|nr:thrombospondin type 3 repeat-containing protein [Flavobacteriaceae bacterium]